MRPPGRQARLRPASDHSPTSPVLRANPFPEVTDLICRLPLPTLFYRLEAEHLRNLMRIRVRFGGKTTSLDFSRTTRCAQDATGTAAFCRLGVPISGSTNSRECGLQAEKKTLPWALSDVAKQLCVAALADCENLPFPTPSQGILTLFPFAIGRCTEAQTSIPRALASGLGPTEPHATAVHVEPFPPSVLKVLT